MIKFMHCPDCRTDRQVVELMATNLVDPEGAPISTIRFACRHSISISPREEEGGDDND